jgi:hypothetical protein
VLPRVAGRLACLLVEHQARSLLYEESDDGRTFDGRRGWSQAFISDYVRVSPRPLAGKQGIAQPGWTLRDRVPTPKVMNAPRHAVLEIVGFLAPSWRWPAGTTGTVVEADDQHALVEIIDDRGHASDFLSLPRDKLASAGHRSARAAS